LSDIFKINIIYTSLFCLVVWFVNNHHVIYMFKIIKIQIQRRKVNLNFILILELFFLELLRINLQEQCTKKLYAELINLYGFRLYKSKTVKFSRI
jgi:hypothetical protein